MDFENHGFTLGSRSLFLRKLASMMMVDEDDDAEDVMSAAEDAPEPEPQPEPTPGSSS